MLRHMILVCHAADGHLADGNRAGVSRVLNQAKGVSELIPLDPDRVEVVCADGNRIVVIAPGLQGGRAFRRIELYIEAETCSAAMLEFILNLMREGGFGLMDGLDAAQFIVAQPQQVAYFPRLPRPPLLVRSAQELGLNIGHSRPAA